MPDGFADTLAQRIEATTPRPWRSLHGRILTAEYDAEISEQDAALICELANHADRILAAIQAAQPLARLPYPVSADERDDWRVYQQKLIDALATLDAEEATR